MNRELNDPLLTEEKGIITALWKDPRLIEGKKAYELRFQREKMPRWFLLVY
jgi:hypothetical protein